MVGTIIKVFPKSLISLSLDKKSFQCVATKTSILYKLYKGRIWKTFVSGIFTGFMLCDN